MGNSIVRETHDFLQSLHSRGAQPNMVASTFRKGKTAARRSRRGALVVEVSPWNDYVDELPSSVEVDEDANTNNINHMGRLAPIWIAAPTNNANQQNRNAVLTPTNLMAHASWKHFGNMGKSLGFYYSLTSSSFYFGQFHSSSFVFHCSRVDSSSRVHY